MLRIMLMVFLVISFSFLSGERSIASDDQDNPGKMIAVQLCSKCHAVEVVGDSPMKEAPPFRTFAKKWPLEFLEEALAEGIVTAHPAMPEFQFKPYQIGALIRYLHSLQSEEK